MIKNRHLPNGLKEFNSVFSILSRKYEASMIFDDLLSIIICCLAHGTQEQWYFDIINRYNKDELEHFVKLFALLQIQYYTAQKNEEWCDPLGTFYEELASNSKKSGFGQFFTPKDVCDLMTMFIVDKDDWGKNINEPCSGSGRMILSANHHAPNNYYVAQDLDPICAKMTAVNMCFHKIRGEVHCMNVLKMTDPRFSLHVNYDWYKHKTLCILKAKKPS